MPTCDKSDLVVHQGEIERPRELKGFFLIAFRFSRMMGQQELRCSANDGFFTTSIPCPRRGCHGTVQSAYLRGIYLVPRLILYVPFVLVLSLGVVRATCGIGFLFWPIITCVFGWIYSASFLQSLLATAASATCSTKTSRTHSTRRMRPLSS